MLYDHKLQVHISLSQCSNSMHTRSTDFRAVNKLKMSAQLTFVGIHSRRTDHLAYQQVLLLYMSCE